MNNMLKKVNTKTLIHYESLTSVAKQIKQNTFNTLSLLWKKFKSREEQILYKFERLRP